MRDRVYAVVKAERLREVLSYTPETGEFIWRVKTGARAVVGAVAGCLQKGEGGGYRVINIDGRSYKASRLAWLYMTGEWPVGEIDHENRRRDDDRWSNLREMTSAQNKENTKKRINNTSGHRCISFFKRTGKYRVRMNKEGKDNWIGYFDTLEEAVVARDNARDELGLLPADDNDDLPTTNDYGSTQARHQRGRCVMCHQRPTTKLKMLCLDEMGEILGLMCDYCSENCAGQLPRRSKRDILVERDDLAKDVRYCATEMERCLKERDECRPQDRARVNAALTAAEIKLQYAATQLVTYWAGTELQPHVVFRARRANKEGAV